MTAGEKIGDERQPQTMGGIPRRALLSGLAVLPVFVLAPRALAEPPRVPRVPPPTIRFDVLREGTVIGEHTVDFTRGSDGYSVQTRIDIEVRLLGVSIFAFHHRGTEVWRRDRLQSLRTETSDDGSDFFVDGRATADGFEMTNRKGVETAPADIMVASFWTPSIPRQPRLIDPQRGRVKEQQLLSTEQIELPVAGSTLTATRYRVNGVSDGWVAYDDQGRWIAAELQKKGSNIYYRLRG